MRTKFTISSEQEYLQAHLTVLRNGSRADIPALHNAKQRLTPVLKALYGWIAPAKAHRRHKSAQ